MADASEPHSETVLVLGALEIDLAGHLATFHGRTLQLSSPQFELLPTHAANPRRAEARIEPDAPRLIELSHRLHAHPELAYEEFASSALLADALEAGGLDVARGVYGLETAFLATAGPVRLPEGGKAPHVVICAEYDALPEIGHACGHNIIGSSSVGAGLALAPLADALGFRVSVLGTPAEESGGGKVDLIRAGAFEDADCALMVHPAPMEVVDWHTLAWASIKVTYHGREAHASL